MAIRQRKSRKQFHRPPLPTGLVAAAVARRSRHGPPGADLPPPQRGKAKRERHIGQGLTALQVVRRWRHGPAAAHLPPPQAGHAKRTRHAGMGQTAQPIAHRSRRPTGSTLHSQPPARGRARREKHTTFIPVAGPVIHRPVKSRVAPHLPPPALGKAKRTRHAGMGQTAQPIAHRSRRPTGSTLHSQPPARGKAKRERHIGQGLTALQMARRSRRPTGSALHSRPPEKGRFRRQKRAGLGSTWQPVIRRFRRPTRGNALSPFPYRGRVKHGAAAAWAVSHGGPYKALTFQLRRGLAAGIGGITAADGEPLFATDTQSLYVSYGGTKYLIGPTVVSWPTWTKVTLTYTSFSTAATTNTITLYNVPAGGVLLAVKLKHSVSFRGGGSSAYTISVGLSGGSATQYVAAQDVWQATGNTVLEVSGTNQPACANQAGWTITATAVCTGANLNLITGGSCDFWLLVGVAT